MREKAKKSGWRLYLLFAVLLIMAGCGGPDPFYVRIVSIEDVPEIGTVMMPLVLTGTVRPAFASNTDIVWSVVDAGTTRASISGNILNAEAVGTVTIKAIITDGKAEGKDYTQDFFINIVEPIAEVGVILNGPAKNDVPSIAASPRPGDGDKYTVSAVSWSPNDNPFKGNTQYTVTVTITAKPGRKFTESLTAEINSHTAAISEITDTIVTFSHTFAPTLAKAVTKIEIDSQPAKMKYKHGEVLDLSGLYIKLTYDDGSTDIFAHEELGDIISENPANGITLSHTTHNNQPVTVSIGSHHVNTVNLTVDKATPDIIFPQAAAITYNMTLSQSALTGGSTLYGSFAWQNGATVPSAGTHNYNVVFTPYDTVNYDYSGVSGWDSGTAKAVQLVSITVHKAAGASVGTPNVNGTLNGTSLIITVTPLGSPASGQTVEYARSTTTTTPANGWQDGTTFSGLSLDTTYYIFARSKANDNYNAGTASRSAAIAFFTVTFKIDNGNTVDTQRVLLGGKVTAPPNPTGYFYDGWYTDEAHTNKWDFNSSVTETITLYAKRLLTYGLTLTFEQISEQAPSISVPQISRTGANKETTVSVSNPSQYDSITWVIPAYGITKTDSSITLNSADFMVGKHYLTVEVKKNGVPYSKTITFEVVQ